MTRQAVITLMTDFGVASPYVAQMKGVMLSIAPAVRFVDITHGISPQSIRQGAIAWDDTVRWFPAGSVHVGVVDPGVGTNRPLVAADIDGRIFVCPDNGLLDLVMASATTVRSVELTQRDYWLAAVSSTFHGRDIMAPVAAHLANGVDLNELGRPIRLTARLAWTQPTVRTGEIVGEVWTADSFGNLITNIHHRDLAAAQINPSQATVSMGEREVGPIHTAYGHVPAGSLVALFGSNGRLEIAESMGSAARTMSWSEGQPPHRVTVRLPTGAS